MEADMSRGGLRSLNGIGDSSEMIEKVIHMRETVKDRFWHINYRRF